jgi:tetratricopeptide (TPR) repeat protein
VRWRSDAVVLLALLASVAHVVADDLAGEFSVKNESDPYEWFSKGNTLYSLGRMEDAIKAYDQAIALDSQFAAAWSNKGVALSNLDKYDEAIEAYDRALAIDPQDLAVTILLVIPLARE